MAVINFYLKDNKAKNISKVYIYLSFKGKRIKAPTELRVNPKDWDLKKQKVKHNITGSVEKNLYLHSIYSEVDTYTDKCLTKRKYPSSQELKDLINFKVELPDEIYGYFDLYINESKTFKKKSTVRQIKSCLYYLKKYSEYKNIKLIFESFDLIFYNDYMGYLLNKCGLENNTVGNKIKNLKAFLRWADERGYHSNNSYQKFKVLHQKKPVIFLDKEELEKIYSCDLSSNPKLEKVRDLFIFQCSTGLRFSDIENLKEENIKTDHLLITTVKVNSIIMIPFNNYSLNVIKKYNNKLPKISNQKFNEYLKDVCKLAKLNEYIQKIKISGGKRVETKMQKWELISSHTARRTFITQCLERGIPPEVVMQYTGHKDIRIMMVYVGITEKVKFAEMDKWNDLRSLRVS